MRSHWFTNSLLCLIVHACPKKAKPKETMTCFIFPRPIYKQASYESGRAGSRNRKQTVICTVFFVAYTSPSSSVQVLMDGVYQH